MAQSTGICSQAIGHTGQLLMYYGSCTGVEEGRRRNKGTEAYTSSKPTALLLHLALCGTQLKWYVYSANMLEMMTCCPDMPLERRKATVVLIEDAHAWHKGQRNAGPAQLHLACYSNGLQLLPQLCSYRC
jgi:hypothetical protein